MDDKMIVNEIVTGLYVVVIIGILYYFTIRPKMEVLEETIKSQNIKIEDMNKRLRWFEDKMIEAGIKGHPD
jgi:hypothetical protein